MIMLVLGSKEEVLSGEDKETDKKFEQWEMKEEERGKSEFISFPKSGSSVSFTLVTVPKEKRI